MTPQVQGIASHNNYALIAEVDGQETFILVEGVLTTVGVLAPGQEFRYVHGKTQDKVLPFDAFKQVYEAILAAAQETRLEPLKEVYVHSGKIAGFDEFNIAARRALGLNARSVADTVREKRD